MSTESRPSLHDFESRRRFFKNFALTTAAATGGYAMVTAGAYADNPQGALGEALDHGQSPGVNVRMFGAQGDGISDDTKAISDAIAYAKEARLPEVLLPAGVFIISQTIKLPSNVALCGQGQGLTTLRAKSGTLFDMFRPDPRTSEIRQRRCMLTSEGVGGIREGVTSRMAVRRMTIDWNHCPTARYGHSVALIDNTDHALLEDLDFINCMPSDHPKTFEERNEDEISIFRGECVMFSNSLDGMMRRCLLTDSGYRPLSVAYNCERIYFVEGAIVAENPVWRHVFFEVHGDGMPRDEDSGFKLSQLIMRDSACWLLGGTGQDGFAYHTGSGVVENCDVYISGGVDRFSSLYRPFDGSRDCAFINNRVYCETPLSSCFSLMSTGRPARSDNINLTCKGNIAHIRLAPQFRGNYALLARMTRATSRNVVVADNNIIVEHDGLAGNHLVQMETTSFFRVSGNLVDLRQIGDAVRRRPTGIGLTNCSMGQVVQNILRGDFEQGLAIKAGENDQITIEGNIIS